MNRFTRGIAYKRLFSSEEGQAILFDLARIYNVLSPKFEPDPRKDAFKAGQRSVIIHLLETLSLDESRIMSEYNRHKELSNDSARE